MRLLLPDEMRNKLCVNTFRYINAQKCDHIITINRYNCLWLFWDDNFLNTNSFMHGRGKECMRKITIHATYSMESAVNGKTCYAIRTNYDNYYYLVFVR